MLLRTERRQHFLKCQHSEFFLDFKYFIQEENCLENWILVDLCILSNITLGNVK